LRLIFFEGCPPSAGNVLHLPADFEHFVRYGIDFSVGFSVAQRQVSAAPPAQVPDRPEKTA